VTPTFVVTVWPNPLIETRKARVEGVITVVTDPSFAGDMVSVSSSQLQGSCVLSVFAHNGTATLNGNGKAHVRFRGRDCAPGTNVIEASLDAAPYYTGLAMLRIGPSHR